MKQLEKDYTTLEQSKRLLKLGIPEWTANLKYEEYIETPSLVETPFFIKRCTIDDGYSSYDVEYLPCWSVGRMIEIVKICCTDDNVKDEIAIEVMFSYKNSAQLIIEMMSEYAYVMDFSKLETNYDK